MPQLTKAQLDSAQEFATAAVATLKTDAGIHPGTAIAAFGFVEGTKTAPLDLLNQGR